MPGAVDVNALRLYWKPVMAFGLELMGATDVKNYNKSWNEYGNDKETPKEKK